MAGIIRPIRFPMSADLAKAMQLEHVPVFMQRAGIAADAFALDKGEPDYTAVNCTRELAAGFVEGMKKMIDSPTHLPSARRSAPQSLPKSRTRSVTSEMPRTTSVAFRHAAAIYLGELPSSNGRRVSNGDRRSAAVNSASDMMGHVAGMGARRRACFAL